MKELSFSGEGAGDEQWRAFPFDTPDLFLRFELTSLTVKSTGFGGVFKKWKIRYNLHEYHRAPMTLAAQELMRRCSLNGGANGVTTSTVQSGRLFRSFKPHHSFTQRGQGGVMEQVRSKLHQTRAMISFKQFSDNMPCFDIMHSGVSVKFPPEKKKVRPIVLPARFSGGSCGWDGGV
jgi:hypothetical protein